MHYFDIYLHRELPLVFEAGAHRWTVQPTWVTGWGYIAAFRDDSSAHFKLGGQAGNEAQLHTFATVGWFAWYSDLRTSHRLHHRMAELGLIRLVPSHERGWMEWHYRAKAGAIWMPVQTIQKSRVTCA